MKEKLTAYNKTCKVHFDKIHLTGYGMHTGEMLFIEGSDIHWGDPVNTSSKLGQDIAEDGDVLIMPIVYEAVKA